MQLTRIRTVDVIGKQQLLFQWFIYYGRTMYTYGAEFSIHFYTC